MPLTPPPPAPNPSDPLNFEARADAHIAWQATNVAELAALQNDVSVKQGATTTAYNNAVAAGLPNAASNAELARTSAASALADKNSASKSAGDANAAALAAAKVALSMSGGPVVSINNKTGVVALTAADMPNTPAGNIVATNVQLALNRLDSEKAPIASPMFSGNVGIGGPAAYDLHVTKDKPAEAVLMGVQNTSSVAASRAGMIAYAAGGGTNNYLIIQQSQNGNSYITNSSTNGAIVVTAGGVDRVRVDSVGNVLALAGMLGYGGGGSVTQATSKSTNVTLNKPSGLVTMHAASLAPGASVGFSILNSLASVDDGPRLTIRTGSVGNPADYSIDAAAGAGLIYVYLKNISGIAKAEALQFNLEIIKGAIA